MNDGGLTALRGIKTCTFIADGGNHRIVFNYNYVVAITQAGRLKQ
jgi:hypothetical protein